MLRAFGIATAGEVAVSSATEAAAAAAHLGFPVALKAVGKTILHKSDVGGVRLELSSPDGVAGAFQAMAVHLGAAMEIEDIERGEARRLCQQPAGGARRLGRSPKGE